jgi:hypothetical protein
MPRRFGRTEHDKKCGSPIRPSSDERVAGERVAAQRVVPATTSRRQSYRHTRFAENNAQLTNCASGTYGFEPGSEAMTATAIDRRSIVKGLLCGCCGCHCRFDGNAGRGRICTTGDRQGRHGEARKLGRAGSSRRCRPPSPPLAPSPGLLAARAPSDLCLALASNAIPGSRGNFTQSYCCQALHGPGIQFTAFRRWRCSPYRRHPIPTEIRAYWLAALDKA